MMETKKRSLWHHGVASARTALRKALDRLELSELSQEDVEQARNKVERAAARLSEALDEETNDD